MKTDPANVSAQLVQLFESLIAQPKLKKGPEWKGDWPSWDKTTWRGDCCGVYVLWRHEDDLDRGNRPVYVGEGITGTRIWDSFHGRAEWQFAQILYDDRFTTEKTGLDWRRLLERFAIVILDPEENRG